MTIRYRNRSAALSTTIAVVLGSPVWAAVPGGLEEIIVAAQRAEANLQETPISVTAVSSEALAQQRAPGCAASTGDYQI